MSIRKLHKKSLKKAQRGNDFRYRPQYMPLNYGMDAGGFNIGDVFNVIKSGYNNLFSGQDLDGDGFKDGSLRQMGAKRKFRRENIIPGMYDYKVMYNEGATPGEYKFNTKDLFEASKFGNRLTGKNVINPTGTLNYSNDPNDPTNTFFTDKQFTLINEDAVNSPPEGLSTLTPEMTGTLINAGQLISGQPMTDYTNRKGRKTFKNILQGLGNTIDAGVKDAGVFIDRLGNNMEDVYKDLIEKGELTLEDIQNKTENFGKVIRNFYETEVKDKLKLQKGGPLERKYDQKRLLEIEKLINAGNIPTEVREQLVNELSDYYNQEQRFIGDLKLNIGDLDDRLRSNELPGSKSIKDFYPDGNPEDIPGGGFVRKNLMNWLEKNDGAACNTYACSILNQTGFTYPINMEPFELYGQTYRGGDRIAVIPGNMAQDSRYNYDAGTEGFVFTDGTKAEPGDYGRIGYPYTGHAVLYTGDYTPSGDPVSVYNPGRPSAGLKEGTYFSPQVTDGQSNTVRYIGNTNYINELLGMLSQDPNNAVAEATTKSSVPKGQYGFNFQGTPLPVFEDQTTFSINPNFDFASILNPVLNNQPTQQEINEQADLDLQARFPSLGPTPAQQQGIDRSSPVIANTEQVQVGIEDPAPPEVQGLKVRRDFGKGLEGIKNRAFTALNRIEDSAAFKAFEDLSEFGVGAASVVNDFFQGKKAIEAEEELREMRMADNQFGVSEVTDRGTYDTNTGLLMPDMSVTTSYGKEGGEVEVDDKTLKQLIAAGADIEIIE